MTSAKLFWSRVKRVLRNPHLIRQWINRPRPEDYLPYANDHQHRATWRWPFLAVCLVNFVMLVLIMLLVGQQAKFTEYTKSTRANLCEMLEVIQYQNQRELRTSYDELRCSELR